MHRERQSAPQGYNCYEEICKVVGIGSVCFALHSVVKTFGGSAVVFIRARGIGPLAGGRGVCITSELYMSFFLDIE